jgi:hypothetical protein
MADHQAEVKFGNDESAMNTSAFGAPLSELAVEMRVGPCVRCGVEAEDSEGGYLENIYIEDGVLCGDNVCEDCATAEDPEFTLDDVFEG